MNESLVHIHNTLPLSQPSEAAALRPPRVGIFIVGGFGAALLIMLSLSVLSYHSTRSLIDANQWIVHTHTVTTALEQTLSLLKDIETGHRGYVITGEESYLEPYHNAQRVLPPLLEEVQRLTADNPQQQRRLAELRPLIEQRVALNQEGVALRAHQGFEAAQQLLLAGQGKQIMDDIRSLMQTMEQEEHDLLRRREQESVETARLTFRVLGSGSALSLLFMAAFGAIIQRQLRQRRQAEQALAALNQQLERRVVERTAALQDAQEIERAQREYFQVTLASIGDGVIVTNPAGVVTFMNTMAEAITGWTTADAMARPLTEIFYIINEETRQLVENPVTRVLHTGAVAGLANHTVLCAKDGRELPIDDSAAPIRDAQGRLQGVVLVFRDISERRQAEAALRRSEERFRLAQEGSLDGFTMLRAVRDAQGQVIDFVTEYANPMALALLHRTAEELIGQSLSQTLPGNLHHHELFTPYVQVLETGQAYERELYYEADGIAGWFRTLTVKIGERIANSFIDITERKAAEAALRASEAQYRQLFNAIDEGFCLMEKVGGTMDTPVEFRYVEANPAFAAHTGVGDVIGKTIGQVFPGESQEWGATYDVVLRTGEPRRFTRTLVTHGRELDLYAFRVDDGTQRRVAVLFRDMTAQKQAAEASLRLAAIVESSEDAIVSKSLEGIVTSWNAGAERIFGYRAEEMIGQSILRILPEERYAEEDMILARLRRGERVDHFETVRRTKRGQLLDVSITISPLRNEQGKIIGASKIARNITERKQAEAARERLLTELQRVNAELQQFAYIVSHDLTEPLRTVRSFVQLLARRTQGQLDPSAHEYITFVTDAAQRMQQMLTDLLAYTKAGERPTFQAVDCEALLRQVLEALQVRIEECGAAITHTPLPIVFGDATRLGQLFQNLIGNALKFCEERPPRVRLSAQQENQYWRFAVQDNGIGIDRQQAARIFQVFQRLHTRREYEGTGMGLAICKRIVEQHGGRIWVESAPGQGATFFFTLPGSQPKVVDP